jgi:hypothetical protein
LGSVTAAAQHTPATTQPDAAMTLNADELGLEPGPSGPLVAAGVTLYPDGGSIGYRLDFGTTLSSGERTDLRLLGVVTFSTDEAAGIETYSLAPFATLQWVRSVLPRQGGRFALILEGGLGPMFAWVKFPDAPFMPEHVESDIRGGGRLAGAVEYRANRGWFGAVQPAGALFAVVDGELEAAFEFAARLGYQWQ